MVPGHFEFIPMILLPLSPSITIMFYRFIIKCYPSKSKALMIFPKIKCVAAVALVQGLVIISRIFLNRSY